jgi:rsbT co-antagonist protein RsbR
MTHHDDPTEVRILRGRLKRLRRLVFDLAAGGLDRIAPFEVSERDDFAAVERTFLAFAAEFIAARRRARELEAENAAVIARQAEMIRTLTAPVIEVADGVVAVPIIGALDEARADVLMAHLLGRIASLRTTAVLIDLSGASEINADILRGVTKLCQAIRLLGTDCVVTGIRPHLAATITSLGMDIGARTARTLGMGLRECAGRTRA